jgi:molecular chaperone GrpE
MTDTDKDDRHASATPAESAATSAHASDQQTQHPDHANSAASSANHAAHDASKNKKQNEQEDKQNEKQNEHGNAKESSKNADGLTPLGKAKKEAADYLAALQRERADFINYRNRMDKEKQLARDYGIQDVLVALLPALDDLDRLREHGDMSKEIEAVSRQLTRGFDKFKIQKFGKKGEAFDPTHHEAILHRTSPDVDKPQIDAVVEAGYSLNGRILRAAKVVVVAPEEKTKSQSTATGVNQTHQESHQSADAPEKADKSDTTNKNDTTSK